MSKKQKIVMEQRACLSCGMKFKTMEGSPSKHCCLDCKINGAPYAKKPKKIEKPETFELELEIPNVKIDAEDFRKRQKKKLTWAGSDGQFKTGSRKVQQMRRERELARLIEQQERDDDDFFI